MTCLDAVWALLEPCASESNVAALDRVSQAREGVEKSLKETLAQSPRYRVIQQDLRSREVAHSQFGPLLKQATEQVADAVEKGKVTPEFMKQFFQDLPQWRSSMRAGTTAFFETLLLSACEQAIASVSSDPAQLDEMALLLADAASSGASEASALRASVSSEQNEWSLDHVRQIGIIVLAALRFAGCPPQNKLLFLNGRVSSEFQYPLETSGVTLRKGISEVGFSVLSLEASTGQYKRLQDECVSSGTALKKSSLLASLIESIAAIASSGEVDTVAHFIQILQRCGDVGLASEAQEEMKKGCELSLSAPAHKAMTPQQNQSIQDLAKKLALVSQLSRSAGV